MTIVDETIHLTIRMLGLRSDEYRIHVRRLCNSEKNISGERGRRAASRASAQLKNLCQLVGASGRYAAMRKSGRIWSAPVSGAVIRLYDCGFVVPNRANCCPVLVFAS